MRSLVLSTLSLLLIAASPATDEASALMDRGEEQRAFTIVERASTGGDADATDYLAWFYDTGRFVAQDQVLAARLYRRAAERGQRHAQWRLGVMLDLGEGVAENPAEAFQWIRRAAGQDSPSGNASLAVMYANGRGVPLDYAQAMHYYRRAAELGAAGGFYGVGVLLARGQGVEANAIEAGGWFIVATILEDQRSATAMEELNLNQDAMRRATARAGAILREFGRDERVTFEEPPPPVA